MRWWTLSSFLRPLFCQAKKMKEDSMNGLLAHRFEEGMRNIREGISQKGGTNKLCKV